ncbi:PilN domain-containing protein [Coxiella burnetii]|uniref:PilN domain-containing protein n=1 Tax=Coxiella burnetii TaxID=777 RepID=UPI000AE29211|nr:hypothetical protein [Coxiella burnetii]
MNINLLPWRQKLQRQKICLFYSLWLASFIFTVAVIGWLNFSLHHSIHLEKKKIAFLTKELSVLPIADNAKVKEINKLLAQRDIISPIKLISEALPTQGILMAPTWFGISFRKLKKQNYLTLFQFLI